MTTPWLHRSIDLNPKLGPHGVLGTRFQDVRALLRVIFVNCWQMTKTEQKSTLSRLLANLVMDLPNLTKLAYIPSTGVAHTC